MNLVSNTRRFVPTSNSLTLPVPAKKGSVSKSLRVAGAAGGLCQIE